MLRVPTKLENVMPKTDFGIVLACVVLLCALPLLLGIVAGIIMAYLVASWLDGLNFPEGKNPPRKPVARRARRGTITFSGIYD